MLYAAYEAQRLALEPLRAAARASARLLEQLPAPLDRLDAVRTARAAQLLFADTRVTHRRLPFGIATTEVDGVRVPVREEVVASTPFATLLRFAKDAPAPSGSAPQPRVLVVAPLSGHFATLLTGTVRALLPDHDVHVTDWHNARDVAVRHGPFGLDDLVDHVVAFLAAIGPGAHVLAVCQPVVPVLAAVALMAEDRHPARPATMTLIAGPVDVTASPTGVNRLATSQPLVWYAANVIETVPPGSAGAGRRVYPGFLQLSGFLAMNPDRHVNAHLGLYRDLAAGEVERARTTRAFYDEYFSVADLPAELYLDTIDAVFQRNRLARGELRWRGRPVRPEAITRTALLTVEGERDDICGPGQTMAAHDLCRALPPYRRRHHLQAGVGHFGVFSGQRWRNQVCPLVRNFIAANDRAA